MGNARVYFVLSELSERYSILCVLYGALEGYDMSMFVGAVRPGRSGCTDLRNDKVELKTLGDQI